MTNQEQYPISQLIENLQAANDDAIILVRRDVDEITHNSLAMVILFTTEELDAQDWRSVISKKAPGMEYFLEVDIAKEVLEVLEEWLERPPTLAQKIEAVIYYAQKDAYIPLEKLPT